MDLLSAWWEGMLMLMQNPPPHVSHTSISQKLRRPLLLVGVVDSGVLLPGVGVPPWAWGRMMGEGLFLDTRALMRCVSLSSFVSGEGLNTAGMKNDSTMKHTSLHIDWRFKSCKGIEQKRAEDSNFLKLRNSKKEVLHSCTLLTLQQAKIHSPNQWHALIAIQLSNVWFNQVGLMEIIYVLYHMNVGSKLTAFFNSYVSIHCNLFLYSIRLSKKYTWFYWHIVQWHWSNCWKKKCLDELQSSNLQCGHQHRNAIGVCCY